MMAKNESPLNPFLPRRMIWGIFALWIGVAAFCAAPDRAQSAQAQGTSASADKESATGNSLGPLHIGMSRKDVESLPFRFKTSTVQMEGDGYVVDTVFLGDGVTIKATFAEGAVADLSTSSVGYENKDGARVGDTLGRLRKLYPGGYVAKGNEEGLFFNFVTESGGQFFAFDAQQLGGECVVSNRKCPKDINQVKSIKLYVR